MEKCKTSCFKMPFVFVLMLSVFCIAAPAYSQALKAYVSTQDGSKVLVYNLSTHQLVKSIEIYKPTHLQQALPPNANDIQVFGDRIFLTVPGAEISKSGINEIKVIDTRTDSVTGTIKTDMTPSELLEYSGKIYVVNRYGNTIQEIDPATLKIIRTIPFKAPVQSPVNNPLTMEIAAGKIYLPYPGGLARPGFVQILDFKTGNAIKTIEFGSISPYGPLAIKKAGEGKIYLGGISNVAVLDTQTDSIVKNIILSGRELNVQSFAVQGHKLYAANGVSSVSVIDIQTDTLITDIDTGYHDYASHLKAGIAAYENKVFVADAGRGIKVIDTAKDKLILTIPSEEALGPVAVTGSR